MTSTLPSSISGQLAPVSLRIRERLDAAAVPYLANDNISDHLLPGELDQLEIRRPTLEDVYLDLVGADAVESEELA